MTRRALAGIRNQVAFWWTRCQFYIKPSFFVFSTASTFLGVFLVSSVKQKTWILLSERPLIPQKRMGDYYHNHRTGYPCLRGALCEAPRRKHTVLFLLNTHIFALLSWRNCSSTNISRFWGGGKSCLGGREIRAFVFPSQRSIAFFLLKRWTKGKKRLMIGSGKDIKLGHRLKFEFQDITADMKPPNRIQWNRIPFFCALNLPLFPEQPREEKSIVHVLILMFDIMHPNEIRAAETSAEPLLTTCAEIELPCSSSSQVWFFQVKWSCCRLTLLAPPWAFNNEEKAAFLFFFILLFREGGNSRDPHSSSRSFTSGCLFKYQSYITAKLPSTRNQPNEAAS